MQCSICGSTDIGHVCKEQVLNPIFYINNKIDQELNYYICNACGFIWHTTDFKQSDYEKFYNKNAPNTIDDIYMRDHFIERYNTLKNYFGELQLFDTIVEIGGGNGDFINLMHANKKIIIDLSEKARRYASEKYPELIFYKTVNDYLKNNNKADLLICCHTLEHIIDVKNFLFNGLSCLKDNGYIYIEVPTLNAFVAMKKNCVYQNIYIEHVNCFTNQTLANLITQLDCSIEFIYTCTKSRFHSVKCLAKKISCANQAKYYFTAHVNKEHDRFHRYGKKIIQMASQKKGKILFWGIGRKLYQIINALNMSERELILEKSIFYDSDKNKRCDNFFGKSINNNFNFNKEEISYICITAESTVTQENIAKQAKKIFNTQFILVSPDFYE